MIGFVGQTSHLCLEITSRRSTKGVLKANKELVEGKWTHVSVVLNRGIAKIYYDTVEVASGSQNTPLNVILKKKFSESLEYILKLI